MIIDRQIDKFLIYEGASISEALRKINENKSRFVFVVSEAGVLEGVCTDGDVRRWLLKQDAVDLSLSVSTVANPRFISARIGDDPARIKRAFSDRIQIIPLVDEQGHLCAVARPKRQDDSISIGGRTIDINSPVFVIAEIGINHNGNLDLARRLVDSAVRSGADCAKFQMRDMRSLYRNAGDADDMSEDLGSQYTLDILSKSQLSADKMFTIFDYCKKVGIVPLCTPWDENSLSNLEEYGMEAYKVASADLTNHGFLISLAHTGKPLICSTGMANESEIKEAIELLNRQGAKYILLHCNSTYPAPFKDVNLNYLEKLRELGKCVVGYSGHERGISIAIAAVAKGARVIEKHLTLDKSMEGNDHKISLLPEEFQAMVQGIREVEESLGSSGERVMSQGEIMNRENLAKSLVAKCDIELGRNISKDMIDVKSPGKGLQPNRMKDLIGRQAKRRINAGEFFYHSDLEVNLVQARQYFFKREWGIPVRYHDYRSLLEKSNPKFLEFHLSYKDMNLDLSSQIQREYDLGLVVHSPDIFAGDHLLNLCSSDRKSQERSIEELQRVVDITRSLKPFFTRAEKPLVVASVGGYTKDHFVSPEERIGMYELVGAGLSRIDSRGVEIIPQTLPAFPWYFGGQLFMNLFVKAEDTVAFCRQFGYRLCLDISHSQLACNHFRHSFKEFVDTVGPFVAHLHVVDAAGVTGEGLQIGEGDIDFPGLAEQLDRVAPKASFIPEIWQGHKNGGEGFWIALDRLEGYF